MASHELYPVKYHSRRPDEVGNNPELIDEGKATAPSKRIIKLVPEYDKVSVGADIAAINGVEFLKEKCRHFNDWITTLENLAAGNY